MKKSVKMRSMTKMPEMKTGPIKVIPRVTRKKLMMMMRMKRRCRPRPSESERCPLLLFRA